MTALQESPLTPFVEANVANGAESYQVEQGPQDVVEEEAGTTELADTAEVLETARLAVETAFGQQPAEQASIAPLTTAEAPAVYYEPRHAKESSFWRKIMPERAKAEPQLKARAATLEDIPELVDVDMRAFASVYKDYGLSEDQLREELTEKFTLRYNKMGGEWIRLVEVDGVIKGFMTCCPTSKTPEEFESWEKMTDNGTLETAYDPDGKNIYIVSLSMLEGAGEAARNMLFTHRIGGIVAGNYDQAFFESRMPGLRTWVRRQCIAEGRDFRTLTEADKGQLAGTYFGLTKTETRKVGWFGDTVENEVLYDYLLRLYSQVGCKAVRVVPNAYKDAQSMDFGAVCVFKNPAPRWARNNVVARKALGVGLHAVSRFPKLMTKMFK